MVGVRWEDFNDYPAGYEKVVKQLITREYDGAISINGRGGDGGVDLRLDHADGLVIFECKNFTKIGAPQKRQIIRSLTNAALHGPRLWVLVVPTDPTPSLHTWFTSLAEEHSFALRWHGRTWLDERMAVHDDLRQAATGGFSPTADKAEANQSTTTNEVSAGTAGTVLQAQSIAGDVHLHTPKIPRLLVLLAILLTAAICSIAIAQWIKPGSSSTAVPPTNGIGHSLQFETTPPFPNPAVEHTSTIDDPCALVMPGEVGQLYGLSVLPQSGRGPDVETGGLLAEDAKVTQDRICSFPLATSAGELRIRMVDLADQANTKAVFSRFQQGAHSPVPGCADECVQAPGRFVARKANRVLMFVDVPSDIAAPRQVPLEELARQAVGRA